MKIKISGCAIINDKKELLLLFHKKHKHYQFPGGKVEPGEDIMQTAIRECKEEIGVDVEIIKQLYVQELHHAGKDLISYKFLAHIKDGKEPVIQEDEIFENLFWMPIDSYMNYPCAPNVIELCQKILSGDLSVEN